MHVSPIPEDYPNVSPYLVMRRASEAIEFYQSAFGAKQRFRMDSPNGNVGHAELSLGNSIIMLADEMPEMGFHSPDHFSGSPVSLAVYVENCDESINKAVSLGAEIIRPIANQFYGDRSGTIKDPFGHVWTLSSRFEKLTHQEIIKRFKEITG